MHHCLYVLDVPGRNQINAFYLSISLGYKLVELMTIAYQSLSVVSYSFYGGIFCTPPLTLSSCPGLGHFGTSTGTIFGSCGEVSERA